MLGSSGMRYVSLTPEEEKQMLEEIGVERIEDLFKSIPEKLRLKNELAIPDAVPEPTLLRYFRNLGEKNASAEKYSYFLGAGAYHHFIPTVVDSLISRSEFYTAYTPYQPEISQGTLQAIFEYQTMVCQLAAMEVANASLYDASSGVAEAVLMAGRITGRKKVAVSSGLHPEYRQVLETYLAHTGFSVDEIPLNKQGGVELNRLEALLTDAHAAVLIQSPNFFGVIEELNTITRLSQPKGTVSIVVVAEALSLGLLKPPGDAGADILVAEGQSLGIPPCFGGPYLGILATREQYKRHMPGRLVGQTVDARGERGFVLTLATREQHIRRQKATSNICTNQGLCALVAAIFLSTLGKHGLRKLAEQNVKKAYYLRQKLDDKLVYKGPIFNELVIRCAQSPEEVNRRLFQERIVGGLPLQKYYSDRADQMLVCVTEQNSRQEIERFVEVVTES